jgi:hypothetical protein
MQFVAEAAPSLYPLNGSVSAGQNKLAMFALPNYLILCRKSCDMFGRSAGAGSGGCGRPTAAPAGVSCPTASATLKKE